MVREPLRQEVRMEKGDGMKKVFGTIAILSFLFLLGTVGSVEQDMIPLGTGVIRMVAGLAAFWLFTWLAGGFDYSYTYDEGEDDE